MSVILRLIGLPGPSHHYGALAPGNMASQQHGGRVAHPQRAALDCLDLMASLLDHDHLVGLWPPQSRPHRPSLRALGYDLDDLPGLLIDDPACLSQLASASAMWAANAATVIAAEDSGDGRLHVLPANLASHAHRSIESRQSHRLLKAALAAVPDAVVHPPLPAAWGDEGAANHLRIWDDHGAVQVLVHGLGPDGARCQAPQRQHWRASRALARRAGLDPSRVVLVQQSLAAIEAGVFHNDIVAMAHGRDCFLHVGAWEQGHTAVTAIRAACPDLRLHLVEEDELDLPTAVSSYLFNSQLFDAADGLHLLAPSRALQLPASRRVIERWRATGVIAACHDLPLHESMDNGGGPACLRLRLPLRAEQAAAVHPGFLIDRERLAWLRSWVQRWYPTTLRLADLASPDWYHRQQAALDELALHCACPAMADKEDDDAYTTG